MLFYNCLDVRPKRARVNKPIAPLGLPNDVYLHRVLPYAIALVLSELKTDLEKDIRYRKIGKVFDNIANPKRHFLIETLITK